MSFKKKLFTTVGPLFLALLLLAGIFLSPFKKESSSARLQNEASSSMAINVIKGNVIKNSAIKGSKYVPFFGSSELSRFNAFHPSVMAKKYDRDYQPFLLGAAGTQSLSHFLMLQSMDKEIQGKKAVFVISPQWFVKGGVSKEMFSLYYSPLQTYEWAMKVNEVNEVEKYTAERLLKFTSVRSDTTMKAVLKQIERGKPLTASQLKMCEMKLNVLHREDQLFARLGLVSKNYKIKKDLKQLPEAYNLAELDDLAYSTGEKSTKSNEFEIVDTFYNKRIAPVKKSLEGSQGHFEYRNSVEFSDFQMLLNEIARLDMDVLFVIPPVNERWTTYTGLPTEMLDGFSEKITTQLKEQGFNNVVDFTQERGTDYFMEDTIHIGWRGWVAMDEKVEPFLETKSAAPHKYKIDNYYLSKEWQKMIP